MKAARDTKDTGIRLEDLNFKKVSMGQFVRKEAVNDKDEYEMEGSMVRPKEVHTQINPAKKPPGVDYYFTEFHITYVWPDGEKSHYWWKESGKNWNADRSSHDAPDGALERAANLIREIKRYY